MLLNEKEYKAKVKKYVAKDISTDIFSYLTEDDMVLVNSYYKAYTVELFKRLRGSLRLQVSESKAKKLVELKGGGNWDFAGMVDTGKLGNAHCELGHALRYCYYAKNTENGSILNFGYRCVGDFFDLDANGVKALNKVKDTMSKELKEIIAIRDLKLTTEHLKYDLDMYGRLLSKIGVDKMGALNHNKRYLYALAFIKRGLPLPLSLRGFLNDDTTLSTYITPGLLGLDSYIPFCDSKIPLLSKGYKELCDLEVLKIVDPKRASYNRDIINKYIDLTDIKKWEYRERFFIALNDFYSKEGITDWAKISIQSTHYIRATDTAVDKNVIDMGANLMNSFSVGSEVQRYNLSGVNELPYKVNGVAINKKAIKNIDYLLKQINEEDVLEEFKKLKLYTNQKIEKRLASLSDEERIIRYLRVNIAKDKYAKIGKGIEITKDIVLKRGLTLDVMSEPQKNVVLNVHRIMSNMDREDGVESDLNVESTFTPKKDSSPKKDSKATESSTKSDEVNNVYKLTDREDIRIKIDTLMNGSLKDKIGEYSLAIMNNVLNKGTVSDKQIKSIVKVYNSLYPKVANSIDLDSRQDIKDKMTKIINSDMFNSLDETTKGILKTVLKDNVVTSKQLYYIDMAFENLPKDLANSENKRYSLQDRPDLLPMINSLSSRGDLDEKTSDILANVLKYRNVTDRQLKYLNMAYLGNVLESC